MGPATSARSARAASLGAALTAAVLLALFPVWEQDWGWQVRAGEERLTSRRPLSGRDEWSYTARGAPWVDVQWAATSVMGAAHLTAGPGGLVALRATLSGLVALGAFASFRQSEAGGSSPASAPAALCVWALAFLAMRDRLQIRSEMFVFALGAWVPSLFAASPSASTLTMAVAVAAAANLHFGVAPFVACHACSLVLGEGLGAGAGLSPLVLRLLPLTFKCAATLLALLANPAPLYAARFFWHHVFYLRDKLLRNPDHVRASWASLAAPGGEEGASLWAWATATALAVWIYFGCLSGGLGRSLRPRGYQNPAVFVISVLTLSLGCLERVRIVPFAVLYLLPVLMAGAASLGWEKKGDGGGRSNCEEKKKKKNARYMHPQAETLWWSLAAALLAVHFGIGQGVRVGVPSGRGTVARGLGRVRPLGEPSGQHLPHLHVRELPRVCVPGEAPDVRGHARDHLPEQRARVSRGVPQPSGSAGPPRATQRQHDPDEDPWHAAATLRGVARYYAGVHPPRRVGGALLG